MISTIFMKRIRLIILSLMLVLPGILPLQLKAQDENNFEISKNLDIYISLFKELDKNYADKIDPGKLNETAIDAMLESLDPYTVFIPESRAEDYKLITTGQYGGIGALIHKQGDYVVISEPYEGFPAQKSDLRPGDRILEINNKSVKGKTTDEVSELLKGTAGAALEITIQREGAQDTIHKTIVREEIKIPDVPYYGMLNDQIGYICLTGFMQNSGAEVKKAFTDLKNNHDLKGIVLDLRGNGGGLLNEAVNIINIWVDKGQLVVSTKGKDPSKNQDHFTRVAAMDPTIPIAVLVDRSSASASEIVAGAIQDLDRGVIIGKRTFGKGLVQNVIPLTYNSQVKITVAKYYIPSGRCIQAIDYFNKNSDGTPEKVPDSLITEFKTKHGRLVYDGCGVDPDIKVMPEKLSLISQTLITKFLIFDFANKFYREHASIDPPDKFTVTDDIYNDFVAFLKEKDYDYTTASEQALEDLKKDTQKDKYYDNIKQDLADLKTKIMHNKNEDLITNKDEIMDILKDELVSRYYYQKGRIIASLETDPDVQKAIDVLKEKDNYAGILDGSIKTDEKKPGQDQN